MRVKKNTLFPRSYECVRDGRTDRPTYRDARARLKTVRKHNILLSILHPIFNHRTTTSGTYPPTPTKLTLSLTSCVAKPPTGF